jgi:replicative DNA helicase
MSFYFEMFASRLIDDNDATPLARFGVEESHLETEAERKAYRFIKEYSTENGGKVPSAEVLSANVADFTYLPQIQDSYEYLARGIKQTAAKRGINEILEGEYGKKFLESDDGISLVDDLISELEQVKIRTTVRESPGMSIKTDVEKFKQEYYDRKQGKSSRVWKSKFDFINKATGGYVSSNMYVVYGKSGRGKSATSLEECVELAFQGANVLIWLLEMGSFEGFVRLYTYISGRLGITEANIDGVNMDAGFNSRDIRHGQLNEEFEARFMKFLDEINDVVLGNITVRAVDDTDFHKRSLAELKSDIIETNADVVLVDPFYYLDYEINTSRTKGGDAARTSQQLRRLTGEMDVVTFAITQADEVDESEDDDGNRELRLPKRSEVSKTKQLLQDAAALIAVDTNAKEGRGIIGLNKGRDGGEGDSAEIIYLPQIGVIKQASTGAAVASQFNF